MGISSDILLSVDNNDVWRRCHSRYSIKKSKEMSYKSDFGKPACYEAPKVSVFNIVSEGSFCSSSLSVGSHSYTEDPEDFEYGGML